MKFKESRKLLSPHWLSVKTASLCSLKFKIHFTVPHVGNLDWASTHAVSVKKDKKNKTKKHEE